MKESQQTKVTEYNGASHENGGVPLGNTGKEVEGGETRFKDFVYSDRILVPETRETFAEVSKKIKKKYSDRPNDVLAQESLNKELERLAATQEQLKQDMAPPPKPPDGVPRAEGGEGMGQGMQMQQQAMQQQQGGVSEGQQVMPSDGSGMAEGSQQVPIQAQPEQQLGQQMAFGGDVNKLAMGGDDDHDFKQMQKTVDAMSFDNGNEPEFVNNEDIINRGNLVFQGDENGGQLVDKDGKVIKTVSKQFIISNGGVDKLKTYGVSPIHGNRYNNSFNDPLNAEDGAENNVVKTDPVNSNNNQTNTGRQVTTAGGLSNAQGANYNYNFGNTQQSYIKPDNPSIGRTANAYTNNDDITRKDQDDAGLGTPAYKASGDDNGTSDDASKYKAYSGEAKKAFNGNGYDWKNTKDKLGNIYNKLGSSLNGTTTDISGMGQGLINSAGDIYDIYRGSKGGSPEYYDRVQAARLDRLDPTRTIQMQKEMGNQLGTRIRQTGGQGMGQYLNNMTQAATGTQAGIANTMGQYDNQNTSISNQEAMNRQSVQASNINLDMAQGDINARERDEARNTLQSGLTGLGQQLGQSINDNKARNMEKWTIENFIDSPDYNVVFNADGTVTPVRKKVKKD